ncbi:MAG: hypothetical protein ACPGOZ_04665, partial [Candidatus Puniceispirillum sp.]
IVAHNHIPVSVQQASPDDSRIYAAMIRHASRRGVDELALSLAQKSVELVPDDVLLRIILAKLYIKAELCPPALLHLNHAQDLIDPHINDPVNIRYSVTIHRMRMSCASFVENAAFISLHGQRESSLLDRPGDDIVPIDKGSLLDRYCHALGFLCKHPGKVELHKGDRGGTSIWFHVGVISCIRGYAVWTPSIRTEMFRRLNSKPHFGLHGAKIQLDMQRPIGKKRRFDSSLSVQSVIAQQGAEQSKLTHEAWRMDMALWHFITKRINVGTGIAQTRIQQNLRHSKRFETRLDINAEVTKNLHAKAGMTWTRTLRKGGALSSISREMHIGISAHLSPSIFAGASWRNSKTAYARPLAYLRVPHRVNRRTLTTNIGLYLTKDRASMVDLHFVRTSSVSPACRGCRILTLFNGIGCIAGRFASYG